MQFFLCEDLAKHDTVKYPLDTFDPRTGFLPSYQLVSLAIQMHKYACRDQPGMFGWMDDSFGPGTFDIIKKSNNTWGPDWIYHPEAKWCITNGFVFFRDDATLMRVKLRWA